LPEIGVLLVEDERLLDRVVADALRTIGVPCETVSCEEEAVRRLTERRYDLVISDLRIQRGSGVNVLRHARALYPDLPVIVVTAYAADEEVYHALALGVDALLYKPFDIDTLLNTVRALLARRAPTAYAAVQMPADARRGSAGSQWARWRRSAPSRTRFWGGCCRRTRCSSACAPNGLSRPTQHAGRWSGQAATRSISSTPARDGDRTPRAATCCGYCAYRA
jgi:DNA-binding response OmpR family regulator